MKASKAIALSFANNFALYFSFYFDIVARASSKTLKGLLVTLPDRREKSDEFRFVVQIPGVIQVSNSSNPRQQNQTQNFMHYN